MELCLPGVNGGGGRRNEGRKAQREVLMIVERGRKREKSRPHVHF